MILVDSSVWIDYFNNHDTRQTNTLQLQLNIGPIGIGDIILTEVLQGFRSDGSYRDAKQLLTELSVFDMLGFDNAIRSAENYRSLRKQGVTIRKTTDVMIASYCIAADHSLLFSDTDFESFVEHLGLVAVR